MTATLSRASSSPIPTILPHVFRHLIRRQQSTSILASKARAALLKKDEKDVEKIPPLLPGSEIPASYQFIYPEFLAEPDMTRRSPVREKLERKDMLQRRAVMDIPEFYAGSVLAVTISDPNAPTKTSRFVGICICRGGHGLRAYAILRNVVDGLGMEIRYDLYNPTLRKIEVLKLERRLDDQLFYLRDCAPEHSTFPFNMELQLHPPGAAIPLNETVLKLNPLPWKTRWELYGFKGITWDPFPEDIRTYDGRRRRKLEDFYAKNEFNKYDILAKYRKRIPLEDQAEMLGDVLVFKNAKFEKQKFQR